MSVRKKTFADIEKVFQIIQMMESYLMETLLSTLKEERSLPEQVVDLLIVSIHVEVRWSRAGSSGLSLVIFTV